MGVCQLLGDSGATEVVLSQVMTGITSYEDIINNCQPMCSGGGVYTVTLPRELGENDLFVMLYVEYDNGEVDYAAYDLAVDDSYTGNYYYVVYTKNGNDYTFNFSDWSGEFYSYPLVLDSANTQFSIVQDGDLMYIDGFTGSTSMEVTMMRSNGGLINVPTPYVIKDPQHIHYSGTWGIKLSANNRCFVTNGFVGEGAYRWRNGLDFQYSYDGINWQDWEYDGDYASQYSFTNTQNNHFLTMLEFGTEEHPFVWLRGYEKNENAILNPPENGMPSLYFSPNSLDFLHGYCNIPTFVTISGNIDSIVSNSRRFVETAPCLSSFFMDAPIIDASGLVIPYEKMSEGCFFQLFYRNIYLMFPPELPSTVLADGCYNNMFAECYNLRRSPVLPAEYIPDQAYDSMFNNCENLQEITCYATSSYTNAYDSIMFCENWVYGVHSTGRFYGRCVVNPDNIDQGYPVWSNYRYLSSLPSSTPWDYIPIEPDCQSGGGIDDIN